ARASRKGARLEYGSRGIDGTSGKRPPRRSSFVGRGCWALLGLGGKVFYEILRWLYGATEWLSTDAIPLCPGQIATRRLEDPAGTIDFRRCRQCGSTGIAAWDDRGRRWESTYTHPLPDQRLPRFRVGICRGILLSRVKRSLVLESLAHR